MFCERKITIFHSHRARGPCLHLSLALSPLLIIFSRSHRGKKFISRTLINLISYESERVLLIIISVRPLLCALLLFAKTAADAIELTPSESETRDRFFLSLHFSSNLIRLLTLCTRGERTVRGERKSRRLPGRQCAVKFNYVN
jgi:hypothetical protein